LTGLLSKLVFQYNHLLQADITEFLFRLFKSIITYLFDSPTLPPLRIQLPVQHEVIRSGPVLQVLRVELPSVRGRKHAHPTVRPLTLVNHCLQNILLDWRQILVQAAALIAAQRWVIAI
jgi:hypothetical protein